MPKEMEVGTRFGPGETPAKVRSRTGQYEWWKSPKNGQWYFHKVSGNGEILSPSEGYKTESACLNGIEADRHVSLHGPAIKIDYKASQDRKRRYKARVSRKAERDK